MANFFQIQFPLYAAYKNTHPTTETISTQESNILGTFCDMNDIPLHLLQLYVCSVGKIAFLSRIGLITELLKLPFLISHAFITVLSDIR